jgi:hypothetical protein
MQGMFQSATARSQSFHHPSGRYRTFGIKTSTHGIERCRDRRPCARRQRRFLRGCSGRPNARTPDRAFSRWRASRRRCSSRHRRQQLSVSSLCGALPWPTTTSGSRSKKVRPLRLPSRFARVLTLVHCGSARRRQDHGCRDAIALRRSSHVLQPRAPIPTARHCRGSGFA